MSSKQRTWWQEMGVISRGMMFLDGSIATPQSLQPAEREPVQRSSSATSDEVPHAYPKTRTRAARLVRKAQWWKDELLLLGGRPTAVRHNDDIDEPFPPLHRRRDTKRQRRSQVAQDCTVYGARP